MADFLVLTPDMVRKGNGNDHWQPRLLKMKRVGLAGKCELSIIPGTSLPFPHSSDLTRLVNVKKRFEKLAVREFS